MIWFSRRFQKQFSFRSAEYKVVFSSQRIHILDTLFPLNSISLSRRRFRDIIARIQEIESKEV